jgi:hypothetical protein
MAQPWMFMMMMMNNPIDLLMKKFSTVCHKIRDAKTYMSALSLKNDLSCFLSLGCELRNYILGKLVA